jgi:lysozyme family protein
MHKFNKAIEVILKHEGGYVNNPKDPGGETNFGISKRAYPKLDIKNLTQDEAKAIYYRDYWRSMQLSHINDELLALHLFDFAVNAGIARAAKMMQSLLGITADGIIGPITITRINKHPMPGRLRNFYIDARKDFYKFIAKKRPALKQFLKGWLKRVDDCNMI